MTKSVVPSSRKLPTKPIRWAVAMVAVVVLWILLPPFRIVELDEQGKISVGGSEAAAFDPAGFVDQFWGETLAPELESATPLEELVAAVARDPAAARNRFGRHEGEGGIAYYFAGGEGTVAEIKGRRAIIELDGHAISLLIAPPVFGNSVRDGTGLLNVNQFPGLEEYNAVSAFLNGKIEAELMPPLKETVQVGVRIAFVGCAKAPESVGDGPALEFVPLRVEIAK